MNREIIEVPAFAGWIKGSTTPVSMVVKGNGMVFVSGLPPFDPATGKVALMDVVAQTTRVLENIGLCLEAAGSSFDKVLQCRVYVTNAAYFSTINEIYARYFKGMPPARVFVVVGSWPAPFDVEIEVTALA